MRRAAMVGRAFLLAGALFVCGVSVAGAAGARTPAHMAIVSFHLRVDRSPPAQMTFWVAYGPPAPRFGVVRLRRAATNVYVGAFPFPAGLRLSFTYLAAWSTVRTPAGLMPGGSVAVIKRTSRLPISPGAAPTVEWSGPTG